MYAIIGAVQGTNRKPYNFFKENPLASFIDDKAQLSSTAKIKLGN
jgi:hypothetical protein